MSNYKSQSWHSIAVNTVFAMLGRIQTETYLHLQ